MKLVKFFKMRHERKQLALQAELNFLKGQIHPHFLFNTLNNLYALTLNQSSKSPAVVLGLSEILRYMLYECNTDNVKLEREVEVIKNYISLEKIRYEERLEINCSLSGDVQNKYIAPLLMLPLVENAFKHGTSETIVDPWINIEINITESQLKFKVSNSKPLQKSENNETHFEKIGLSNVQKRLDFLYKDGYQFHTYDEEEIYVAILEINLNTKCTKEDN